MEFTMLSLLPFLLPFGTALILAAIGIYLLRSHEVMLKRYSCETDAFISEIRHRGTYYYPVFEYDYAGQHFQKRSTVGTSPPMYQAGQSVKIKIDPENPEKFITIDGKISKFAAVILFLIAGFFGIASIFILIFFILTGG